MQNYFDDTLTNAHRNRAASRKLFEHWSTGKVVLADRDDAGPSAFPCTPIVQQNQQQLQHRQLSIMNGGNGTTSFLEHSSLSQSQPHILLHRSPSGAQRKIRQKAQLQQQQQQASTASSLNNSHPATENSRQDIFGQQLPYRNLIQDNAYRPIPMDNPNGMDCISVPVGQLIDRMNRLETSHSSSALERPKGESSWLGGSIDKITMPLEKQHVSSALLFGKPTVQVHPLPVPPRHRSMSLLSSTASGQKPIPPPLPPKKQSLLMPQLEKEVKLAAENNGIQQQLAADFRARETNIPVEKGSQWARERVMAEFKSGELLTKAESKPNTLLMTSSTSSASPFPSSLSSSPSLTSLQNCLQFAAENPEKHSREQLEELEQRRLHSIESLAKKVAEREQDRLLLCRDLDEVDQVRASLFSRISNRPQLIGRLHIFLAEMECIVELETQIQCQLYRLNQARKRRMTIESRLMKATETESLEEVQAERARKLQDLTNDLQILRGAFEIRERMLDAEMAEELGEAEAFQEWLFCREQLVKLNAERSQLDEKLRDVRELLESLQRICLLAKLDEE